VIISLADALLVDPVRLVLRAFANFRKIRSVAEVADLWSNSEKVHGVEA
jgi:hypothetical protein